MSAPCWSNAPQYIVFKLVPGKDGKTDKLPVNPKTGAVSTHGECGLSRAAQ